MLYIMRHGKTEWNALKKLQGRTDIPLNDEGRAMAKRACIEIAPIHIDICYSSPLSRALETAQTVLRGRDIPIITDDRLAEMSFGEFEGSVNYFHNPEFPLNPLFDQPERYTESIGGAETFDELFARTGEFLSQIVEPKLQAGKDVLIVGHGAMNASIVCQVKNIDIRDFWSAGLEQCKLIRLR